MGYRNPELYFLHAGRSPGASIVASHQDAAFPASRLVDSATRRVFDNGQVAVTSVTVDRGAPASRVEDEVDTLILANHDHSPGDAWQVEASATGAFAGEEVSLGSGTIAASGLLFESLISSALQHLRYTMATSSRWTAGELVFTRRRPLLVGIDPEYSDAPGAIYGETIMLTGESYRTILGPEQRVIVVAWNRIEDADKAVIDDLTVETQGGVDSFWLLSPDDTKPLAHVKLSPQGRELLISRRQDSPNPTATGIQERVELDMREVIE